MDRQWILVANASEAVLYYYEAPVSPKKKPSLELVFELEHPQSREKDVNLASDRLGHYQGRGTGHGSFVESSDPKQYEAEQFAKELADKLNVGRVHQRYDKLTLVAPPHFIGLLHQQLNTNVRQLVSTEIQKDYTKEKMDQLIQLLSLGYAP